MSILFAHTEANWVFFNFPQWSTEQSISFCLMTRNYIKTVLKLYKNKKERQTIRYFAALFLFCV